MGIVAFITMGAVMLFLPLGIVKGLVQKFLLTEDSAFYTISVNVILHAVGISLICFGGYYCSQENLIQYSFATTTNFLFIFLIGSFLFCLDVFFINSVYLRHFFSNRYTPDKPLLKYIYCLILPLSTSNTVAKSSQYSIVLKYFNEFSKPVYSGLFLSSL